MNLISSVRTLMRSESFHHFNGFALHDVERCLRGNDGNE